MEEYKSNSHKSKAENKQTDKDKKEIKKVVDGKVRKKSALSKAAGSLINEDVRNVKSYVIMDVLIPAAKKAISDIVSNGIDMLLYGEPRSRRTNSSSYVSYNKYSDRYSDRRDEDYSRRSLRSGYSHEDILLETRSEAEEVLDNMIALIDQYGQVSVADMYDLVGISGQYTDNKYGWTNLRNARPVRVRDGYILELPKAIPID